MILVLPISKSFNSSFGTFFVIQEPSSLVQNLGIVPMHTLPNAKDGVYV